jgi:hypothetical protein
MRPPFQVEFKPELDRYIDSNDFSYLRRNSNVSAKIDCREIPDISI